MLIKGLKPNLTTLKHFVVFYCYLMMNSNQTC